MTTPKTERDAAWLVDRIQYIKGKKKPTEQESLLVALAEMQERDTDAEKMLAVLVKAEKAESAAREARAVATAKVNEQSDETRKLETGQKVILGGFFLHELRTNRKTREWFLMEWETRITRDNDQKRLAPLLNELRILQRPIG